MTPGKPDDPSAAPAFMDMALSLARRGLGSVWPNPTVGCVIVNDSRVVGRGWTQPGGRPHAETEALWRAGAAAQGATAHVSLEPCSHHGVTGPCADALISAGVARAIVAMKDPDPRVSGAGLKRLEAAGIDVVLGRGAEQAAEINGGFLLRVTEGRPLFTLKTATTLDGRIATQTGDSQWITGAGARAAGHLLRLQHDAIMVGSNTALTDDPLLTVRLPGTEGARGKPRIVFDGRLRLPPEGRLARSAEVEPLWIVTRAGHAAELRGPLEACGATLIEVSADATGALDIAAAAHALAGRGLTRILVEGGGRLAASLLKADLVDRVAWFRAPTIMGAEGRPAVAELGIKKVSELFEFTTSSEMRYACDAVEMLIRKRT